MHVGILGGTGPLGRGLALRLAASGNEVAVGSRHEDRARDVAAELRAGHPGRDLPISGITNADAARSELVVLATVWEAAVPTAAEHADALSGRVVVCVANALVKQGREIHALTPARGSLAAAVQAAAPGALVAAACQHLPAATLADLEKPLEADVLVCADVAEAKEAAMGMVRSIPGLRPLDAGGLASAGAIEAFTAVLVTLNIRYKAHSTMRLGGLDHAP